MNIQQPIGGLVERIARALERLAPLPLRKPDFDRAQTFVWRAEPEAFVPVIDVNRVPLSLLKGIDAMRDVLLENTLRFAKGLPANNALLWGARGMGKSSLVKAVHAAVIQEAGTKAGDLKLIEIHREDIGTLPHCLAHLREAKDSASSCSATTSPSKRQTPPTSRSRPCLKAASRGDQSMCCSTQPPTGVT